MANRAASALLTLVKDHLNNQTICTDTELYRWINRSYQKWFQWLQNRHPQQLKTEKSLTYTASAESYDLSGSFSDIPYRIESVRDVTDGNPGVPIEELDSHESMIRMQYNGVINTTVYGTPTHWYFYRDFTESSGVYTIKQTIMLAPIPTRAVGFDHGNHIHNRSSWLHGRVDMPGRSHQGKAPGG